MIGQTISHYHVVDKPGDGGRGVIYEAEDLRLGRRVAVKFLPAHALERSRLPPSRVNPVAAGGTSWAWNRHGCSDVSS